MDRFVVQVVTHAVPIITAIAVQMGLTVAHLKAMSVVWTQACAAPILTHSAVLKHVAPTTRLAVVKTVVEMNRNAAKVMIATRNIVAARTVTVVATNAAVKVFNAAVNSTQRNRRWRLFAKKSLLAIIWGLIQK